MTDSERIIELKKFTGLSFNKLAKEIGLKTVQTLYDIERGKHGISKDVAEKIQSKYLNISMSWLLTGEGEMLNRQNIISNSPVGDNSTQIAGNSNHVNNLSTLDKALDEISEMRKLLAEAIKNNKEQTERFLSIIEKLGK